MTRARLEPCTIRRRAVVAGRLPLAAMPSFDARQLALNSVGGERQFPCRLRPDGRFFFLDVPAGRYTLDRADSAGNVVAKTELAVAPVAADARMPMVQIDLEAADAKAAGHGRVVGRRKLPQA